MTVKDLKKKKKKKKGFLFLFLFCFLSILCFVDYNGYWFILFTLTQSYIFSLQWLDTSENVLVSYIMNILYSKKQT